MLLQPGFDSGRDRIDVDRLRRWRRQIGEPRVNAGLHPGFHLGLDAVLDLGEQLMRDTGRLRLWERGE